MHEREQILANVCIFRTELRLQANSLSTSTSMFFTVYRKFATTKAS